MVFDPFEPLRRDLDRVGRALGISGSELGEAVNPRDIGTPTIIGTPQQIEAAKALLLRAQVDIPISSLNGLTIKFVSEGEYWSPEERLLGTTGEYNPDTKTLYIAPTATERTFYHEIAHYLADREGQLFGYGYHKKARVFGRKWGTLQRITRRS